MDELWHLFPLAKESFQPVQVDVLCPQNCQLLWRTFSTDTKWSPANTQLHSVCTTSILHRLFISYYKICQIYQTVCKIKINGPVLSTSLTRSLNTPVMRTLCLWHLACRQNSTSFRVIFVLHTIYPCNAKFFCHINLTKIFQYSSVCALW